MKIAVRGLWPLSMAAAHSGLSEVELRRQLPVTKDGRVRGFDVVYGLRNRNLIGKGDEAYYSVGDSLEWDLTQPGTQLFVTQDDIDDDIAAEEAEDATYRRRQEHGVPGWWPDYLVSSG